MKKELFLPLFSFRKDIPRKRGTPHRIKINGEYIQLGNTNKTVWPNIGAAKNALDCHLKTYITRAILLDRGVKPHATYCNVAHYYGKDVDEAWREWLEWAQETKFLEFVPFEQ